MNDDIVVQKILKLLENNTAFIGYALNGGIGTKINVRNTETGKTIQALSINVDSTGEVLVVKDSEDNQFKAVTFKTAEKVSERIIQLRKTKPTDDKKVIEYTDSDIEVFYLFVKLIDTGSPVPSQLKSTWIRKGSSCTQFVGAYERCNYASKETIGGTSYTGLPYKEYSTLTDCLNDDTGRDAKTPHGSKDENGTNLNWRIYSTKMTGDNEQNLLSALTSHDSYYGTNYKKLFGFGTILECSGAMYVQGWEFAYDSIKEINFIQCEFAYLPGFTLECSSDMQTAGYCDTRGFIGSKTPLPGDPTVGAIDNTWGHQYGWVDLPYEFMYKRHFIPGYVNGAAAQGSFLIIEGLADDQNPTIPEGYFRWYPGCPSDGQPGPYDGSGGSRPENTSLIQKRDMKLSTHKAEIWLGSSKKTQALKLYELSASDLFSGMYNAFIIKANETLIDTENRLNRNFSSTQEDQVKHQKFYENRDKNIIDLKIDPRVWVYVLNNIPKADSQVSFHDQLNPNNFSLLKFVDHLYLRTLNLSVIDKTSQVIHLKIGLTPKNSLSNTDCKGVAAFSGFTKANDNFCGQSWEYQKYITIKIKNWKIESTINTLDTSDLIDTSWNKNHIERKFLTSFGTFENSLRRDFATSLLSRSDFNTSLSEVVSGNHYEQYNYDNARLWQSYTLSNPLYISHTKIFKAISFEDNYRKVGLVSTSWWELWDKTYYNKKTKILNSVVGYEKNNYQILVSSGLDSSLGYSSTNLSFSEAVSGDSYYEYLTDRPKSYTFSAIKQVRNKLFDFDILTTRERTLDELGLQFFFSNWSSSWARNPSSHLETIPLPSSFYSFPISSNTLRSSENLASPPGVKDHRRFRTDMWTNNLWSQFIYDGFVKIDVDSYKNVNFTLPTNPAQYIKYSDSFLYINSEYSFTNNPKEVTNLNTVLSPGTLDITKQVKITKPTNVDLDPNLSFLVYLYPFVEVTKKKKTI